MLFDANPVGDRSREFAEQQLGFIRSVAVNSQNVTSSYSAKVGNVPMKLKLDQMTPTLAREFNKDPYVTAYKLRWAFVKNAFSKISSFPWRSDMEIANCVYQWLRALTDSLKGSHEHLTGS